MVLARLFHAPGAGKKEKRGRKAALLEKGNRGRWP